MTSIHELDFIAINVKSHRLLDKLLLENPTLGEILRAAANEDQALDGVRNWVNAELRDRPDVVAFQKGRTDRTSFEALEWRDYAAIRLLDYVDNAGLEVPDLNLRGEPAVSDPVRLLWLAVNRGTGGAKPAFFEDMLFLFRQFTGRRDRHPVRSRRQIESWMRRYPSGLDPEIVTLRKENRNRILELIVDFIDRGDIHSGRFKFDEGLSRSEKLEKAREWWTQSDFHLRFAVRSPEMLNELLGRSLDPDTMRILDRAREQGIPFFVNPYYLSLLNVRVPPVACGADLAIRHYILYSEQLVEEFGHIVAWEKEDQVVPGQPNAAGWLLPPYDNVHRRYPDVAILIPDTMGRACGGLCSSCQRMFDFQRGRFNFDLERLRPTVAWPEKLHELMAYFEEDSQLRDILVTGGDALMSTDESIEKVLDAIYEMAQAKREANRSRPDGEKFAEILRVRLGTRLPAYLPQRVGPRLVEVLSRFRRKASAIGVSQFVIQTHFESPMEITPEAKRAIELIRSAGWIVTNQLVFSAPASRRGHSAKLRKVLNDVGALAYYTFVMKGYRENQFNYAPIARVVQEEIEEKAIGRIPEEYLDRIRALPAEADRIDDEIDELREAAGIPFLATDRSVLNLPAVGKSLTFRVIGITRYGRRILEFSHDPTRAHSPIIDEMGKVRVVESKSVGEYLHQLDEMGEVLSEYDGVWGYSLGETEPRMPIYEYPDYPFETTDEITNLRIEHMAGAVAD